MQKIKLEKAMTFSFGNDERLESRTIWPYSLLELLVSMEYCVNTWWPGRAPLLLSRAFLKDIGCHSDLGRGHLSF